MSTLRVSLFGRFRALRNDQSLSGLDASKVQELLCYLLLHRDHPHSREALAAMLWSDNSTAQSRKYLRQTLWQLQIALGSEDESDHEIALSVEPDWVCLSLGDELWLDVHLFEKAFIPAFKVPGPDLSSQVAGMLHDAVQLYRGNLLEGWYQDWCLYERERLQGMHQAMLDKLMGYCQAHGEYELGISYGERVLRYERARERTHRQLMHLYYLSGDRTAALRQYERCAAILREELGVNPARRTTALYEQILGDRLSSGSPMPSIAADEHGGSVTPVAELLRNLRQLTDSLVNMQHQLQQYIQIVEKTSIDKW